MASITAENEPSKVWPIASSTVQGKQLGDARGRKMRAGVARADRPIGAIDRFQRDTRDPSVIAFSEIKRCQLPHSTHFSKSKKDHVRRVPRAEKLAPLQTQNWQILINF